MASSRDLCFPTTNLSRVKGKQFSVPELVGDHSAFESHANDPSAMLSIARLAPQDYHRFHSPVEGEIMVIHDIEGESTISVGHC